MTEAEVEQATGWQFSADEGGNPPDCHHIRAAEDESLALMVTDGRVSRVNISGGGRATTRGVRVGNTEDVVRRAYPRLEEGVDAGGAPTLTWWSSRDKGVRFDIDGDRRVYEMYGGNDAIALSEGCS